MSTEKPSEQLSIFAPASLAKDAISGVVVFLVALPLCLGIAVASGAPPISGLLAGIIGGLVIAVFSGSSTSVSGPAAGLTAIVAAQIANLGSFEAFLLAVFIGGVLQICLGLLKAGSLSAFFPASVIRGLLAAIGTILILKQIPHLFGKDSVQEGELRFQPEHVVESGVELVKEESHSHNTFAEIFSLFDGSSTIHVGAATVGIICLLFLIFWENVKPLKQSIVPGPLLVVILGVILHVVFRGMGDTWAIGKDHLVGIPIEETLQATVQKMIVFPDWNAALKGSAVYIGGITIAIVASLETLLNLEAVDKLDPEKRNSPASRELIAQGVGNMCAGLVGALPTTSVIVRSSVNVQMGAKTKLSAIFHGILLVSAVLLFPKLINMIPLSALAAILLVTGFKLASPKLFAQIWKQGLLQFLPFVITLVSIVLTDLLIGIMIGLAISIIFILHGNLKRPVRRIVETHVGGDLLHIELSNQVSFLSRASLDKVFTDIKPGTSVLIDASDTHYIDSDVLSLITEFKDEVAPAKDITVNLRGFKEDYLGEDDVEFVDYSTRELQDQVTPAQVLEILRAGHERFKTGHRVTRDYSIQVAGTAADQNPYAAVLGGIDSRAPHEFVFDAGIGDILSVRVAGNVIGPQPLASLEYAVRVAGVKVVVVLGNTRCAAVTSSVELLAGDQDVASATGCAHLHSIVDEVSHSVDREECRKAGDMTDDACEAFMDEVTQRNVLRTVDEIVNQSAAIKEAVEGGKVLIIGAMYDVRTGALTFFPEKSHPAGMVS